MASTKELSLLGWFGSPSCVLSSAKRLCSMQASIIESPSVVVSSGSTQKQCHLKMSQRTSSLQTLELRFLG